ncbi:hypothetical protein [Chitinophaga sp. CB10]|uniref:hypothetical protein n=1 Tax=Chitinophaga sp. CB10 TaxID=1891659 RepID=UPI0025BD723D|nr:hypothetical protein [Chitinophaga sp. CB10]
MAKVKLGVKIRETGTGSLVDAVIEPVTLKDYKIIKQSTGRFNKFDWSLYKKKEVYKLRLKANTTILGLMCLIDHTDPDTNAIEIALLEVSVENIGNNKQYDYIGGCLIAFACRESFKRGHEGFVSLVPKSSLIEHYTQHYGFEYFPMQTPSRPCGLMVLYDHLARNLIMKYLSAS